MIIGIIVGVVAWFLSKSILVSFLFFYFTTGIVKTLMWMFNPDITRIPMALMKQNLSAFFIGVLAWPIFLIANKGDLP